MTNRIDKKFKELRREGRKAFIAFLTAGYPDLRTTEALIPELEKSGADIIELGIPFSDPIADGPVIQMASQEALRRGATLKKILALVARVRERSQVPLAAMTYFNPILHYGPVRFAADAARAGLDAVIIPDLPPEEEKAFAHELRRRGLHLILFVAPTTPPERMRRIARQAAGFIYFVSVTGVTGARRALPHELRAQLRAVKRAAGRTPVCVGFGVSSAGQVAFLSRACDGVIVGSALIRGIAACRRRGSVVSAAGRLIKNLRRAL
jgi:tryptophan synthase alpha chain